MGAPLPLGQHLQSAHESESVAESADIYPLVTIVLVVGYGIPKRKQDCSFSPSNRIRHITASSLFGFYRACSSL